jgi:hypothetical protein
MELFDVFSWTRRHLGSFRRRPEEPRGHDKLGRRALGPPGSWVPYGSSNPNLSCINTQIFPVYQRAHQKYFSATASFCSREIPSWGLFQYSAGGGFDHGGPLHQPCCPSNDLWVVYHRPMGPYLVARWLLLSLWSSIQCSPRCSWSSIRCNLLLRCVCWDPMNCGFMNRLSMNIIWVFSELFYAWSS